MRKLIHTSHSQHEHLRPETYTQDYSAKEQKTLHILQGSQDKHHLERYFLSTKNHKTVIKPVYEMPETQEALRLLSYYYFRQGLTGSYMSQVGFNITMQLKMTMKLSLNQNHLFCFSRVLGLQVSSISFS